MERVWKAILQIVGIVAVLSTIGTASYVLYQHRVDPLPTDTLLSWILAVLLLLSVAELTLRYSVLWSTEKRLASLSALANALDGGNLADLFLKERDAFGPFAHKVENAKEICLLGASLEAMVNYHKDIFIQKLRDGCRLRFLLMDPNSTAVGAKSFGLFRANTPDLLRQDIVRTLQHLEEIRGATDNGEIEIRLTEFVPTFAMTSVNPKSPDGLLIVEMYPFNVSYEDRPHFEIKTTDSKWYQYFANQYETIWAASENQND